MSDVDDDGVLFGVPELVEPEPAKIGRAEAALFRAVTAATGEGRLVDLDAGLVGAALVAARGLDAAERGGVTKHGTRSGPQPYAIAALLTPYREVLHGLRLPAATEPEGVPLPDPQASGTPDWLRDALGTAE